MRPDPVAPLDSDVLAFLDAERLLQDPGATSRARALSALQARIATIPPGDGTGSDHGSGTDVGAPGSAPSNSVSPPKAPSAHGLPIGGHASSALVAGRAAQLVGAFVLGAGVATTVAVLREVPRPAPQIVYVERSPVVASAPQVVPPASVSSVPPELSASAVKGPSRPASAAPLPAASSDQLAAERAILDIGRAALAKGQAADALAAVASHEAQFPKGILSEERDALAVRALARAGREQEARRRGERFVTEHPDSVMRQTVEGVLEGEPSKKVNGFPSSAPSQR